MNDSTRLLITSFFLFVISISFTQAATVTAIADGSWSKNIWSSPAGPQPGDSIVIPAGITVELKTVVDLSTPTNDTETKITVYGKLLFYNKTYECALCDEVAIKLDNPSYIYIDQKHGLEEYDDRGDDKQNIYFNNTPVAFTLPFGPGTISVENNTSLPVELVGFSGTAETRENKLFWTTATELHTSHFEVEASVDGANTFRKVGTVAAQGYSNAFVNYSFAQVSQDAKTYYRLKIVDLDGSFDYSNVLIVERNINSFQVSIYPNPVIEDLNVELNVKQSGEVTVQIFNANGRLVKSSDYELSAGQHTLSYQLGASQNTYYVQVIQGNETNTQKVLVNKAR